MVRPWTLALALLLAPASARCQQQAPAGRTAAHRRSRGGGRGGSGGSSSRGDSGGVPEMKQLPCPKGFTARVDSGPHLKLSGDAPAKKNRKSRGAASAGSQPKQLLARRCVPDAPKKKPSAR